MSEYVRPEYTPLFRETQGIIADYLNSDPQISAKQIEFFPEAKLDIDFEVKKALGQQGIVGIVNTLKGTFAGHDGCTNAWQIEAEVDVIENPPVRRSQLKKMGLSTGTVSDILDWVQESLGGPSSPTFAKFNPVSQEIGQNNGLVVGRSIMRTLVLADTSAVISTENQWVCPYALRSELSALYEEVQDISGQIEDAVTEDEMSAYVAQQLSGYLPAEIYGFHDNYATVRKVVEIIDPRSSQSIYEPVLTLAQNGAERSLEIIDTNSLATFNFGVLSSGIPKISFGIDDPETFNTVYFQNKSGTVAYLSDLSDYLSISGGTMYGTIEFSPDSDWEHDLGYKLIQLNPTGENWQVLFGVEDDHGQPYVAHNGSETGSGEISQYTWKLFFPDENGTLATQEWSYGELSGKVDANDLSAYLPLSGGQINGSLSVGTNVVFDQDLGGGMVLVSDGHGNQTYYRENLIGTPNGNLYFPSDIPEQEQYLAIRSDLNSYLNLSGGTMSGDIDMGGQHGVQPMNSEFLKFMEYYFGYFELGSGFGIYRRDEGSALRYPAYLFNENKWETEYDVMRRGDLSGYLSLSGGTLQGSLEIPAQYDLSVGEYQIKDNDFDGFRITDSHGDFWKFSGSSEQPQDVMRRMDISAFPTTDEISATRVETMTTIHESDWADISAQASSSTLYIVIPD